MGNFPRPTVKKVNLGVLSTGVGGVVLFYFAEVVDLWNSVSRISRLALMFITEPRKLRISNTYTTKLP